MSSNATSTIRSRISVAGIAPSSHHFSSLAFGHSREWLAKQAAYRGRSSNGEFSQSPSITTVDFGISSWNSPLRARLFGSRGPPYSPIMSPRFNGMRAKRPRPQSHGATNAARFIGPYAAAVSSAAVLRAPSPSRESSIANVRRRRSARAAVVADGGSGSDGGGGGRRRRAAAAAVKPHGRASARGGTYRAS